MRVRDIRAQVEIIRRGGETARSCLEKALARCDAVEGRINAFTRVHREESLLEAEALDRKQTPDLKQAGLWGLPVAIKDNINESGRVSSAGSAAYGERRPTEDAQVVTLLRRAGAAIFGRTNMHELADGVTSDNPHYGAVRNPWNTDCTPGGSSGGSAACVAAGVVDLAMGSDTGGSVRIPASLCGIVGFKPSLGLIPCDGVMPLSCTLDHLGPIAPRVRDVAWSMRFLAPQVPGDRWQGQADLGRMRIGVLTGFGMEPQPGVARALDLCLVRLEQAGCRLVPAHVPELALGLKALAGIYISEAHAVHAKRFAEAPDLFGEAVREMLKRGSRQAPERRDKAMERRRTIAHSLTRAMEDQALDFLLCPTTPAPARAFPVEDAHHYLIYTCPFNLSGQPALSLPMGLVEGLPVGLQLIGWPGDDARLLACACAIDDRMDPLPAPSVIAS